jgi:thiamine-monophosphate kinase
MTEFAWIDRYLKPIIRSGSAYGLTNDVATLADGRSAPLIVTMDTMVAGVHFLPGDPLVTVARKLVRVNVSDILCKGALASEAMLSLALPYGFAEEAFATLCQALGDEFDHWDIQLLGGDTVSTPGPLTLTLTLTGACLGDGPTQRAGAQPGDGLLVTGEIGHGVLGLDDAMNGQASRHAEHYRVPALPPRQAASLINSFATASLDISDGLLSDAAHIATESMVQLEIVLDDVPFARPASTVDEALRQATGGDDYQILFTVEGGDVERCLNEASQSGVNCALIGRVAEGTGLRLFFAGEDVPIPARAGFSH